MIIARLGKPGAGKSYTSCVMARQELERGRWVITNLPLKLDAWPPGARLISLPFNGWSDPTGFEEWGPRYHEVVGDDGEVRQVQLLGQAFSSADWFRRFEGPEYRVELPDGKVAGPLFIVDEVGICWRDLTFDKPGPGTEVRAWLAQHRHALADVVLVGQSHHQISDKIKPLVESWVELSNLRTLLGVPRFAESTYLTHFGKRDAVKVRQGKFAADVFELYGSHDLGVEVEEVGEEVQVKGAARRWWGYWQVWLIPVGLAAFVWGAVNLWDHASSMMGLGDDGLFAPDVSSLAVGQAGGDSSPRVDNLPVSSRVDNPAPVDSSPRGDNSVPAPVGDRVLIVTPDRVLTERDWLVPDRGSVLVRDCYVIFDLGARADGTMGAAVQLDLPCHARGAAR